MRDTEGGRTGILARAERKKRAEDALQAITNAEFSVTVYGDGRGMHLIDVTIMEAGDRDVVKKGWTIADHKTDEGVRFEGEVRAVVEATKKRGDVVKVSWSCNLLTQHMDTMKRKDKPCS